MQSNRPDRRERIFRSGEWLLVVALFAEIGIFSFVAPNFFSTANFFEVARFSVELGLIAVALTPVIITGGIDLSVGSMMGLAAVVLGTLWRDAHWPLIAAIGTALAIGVAGGLMNALLIARLKIPALVVTLGSYSLFRGVAEGITHGAVNFSGFPSSFLYLGQGYLWNGIPAQVPIFAAVAGAYFVLLHRSVIGRAFYAIGFSAAGARYAGIPVSRRVGFAYVLSGAVASLAGVIYVAHLGQARGDTGSGYELDAITAVVLGGTSIFGGRGSIAGTLFGLFFLSVIQNGLHLAALPSELTGVLTGVLLVTMIAFDRIRRVEKSTGAIQLKRRIVWSGVVAGALIVAATLFSFKRSTASARAASAAGRRLTIAMMPKAKGDPYFVSARAGAEEAARELNVDLIWDGPTTLDAARQNELVESWITRRVDAIAVAVENKGAISTVLRKARSRGIKVLTWDADAEPDARDFFVNQATPEGIANALTAEASRLLNSKGQFAIITGALSAANQNEWIAFIRKRLEDKYAGLKLATIRPSDDDRDKAFSETQTILKVYPETKLIMAISAPAVPGSGEAIRQAGRKDVFVIGLSLPSICRSYIHADVVQTVVLWSTRDLGYLSVYSSVLAAQGKLSAGAASITAGRLGILQIRRSDIVLGDPLIINKSNVDQFDF